MSTPAVRTVEDVCINVTSGGTPSRRKPEYFNGGVPWVKTKELLDGRIVRTEETISEAALTESSAKLLPPNTILMAMYGATVGKLGILSTEMACNQAACAMIVDPDVADYRFLYYTLLNDRARIVGRANGAAQQNLSARTIKSLTYPFPSVARQKVIAATLGALDDKVESNLRQIERVELLGKALLARETSGTSLSNEATLGSILTTLETGRRPRGGATLEGVVSLGAENVRPAGLGSASNFKRVPPEFAASLVMGHLMDGDVLIYKDGAALTKGAPIVGAFGYGHPTDDAVINEHVYRARSDGIISQGLLYWLLSSNSMDSAIRARVTGAVQPGLNSSNLKSAPLPEGIREINKQVGPTLDHLLRLLLHYGAENRRLHSVRDTLMPALFSRLIQHTTGEAAM